MFTPALRLAVIPPEPAATSAASGRPVTPGSEYWRTRPTSLAREYAEVTGVVFGVALAGWFVPVTYHFFGYIYLLTVIALSLRVGRWPVLFAAGLSAVTWNFVFMPPRLSLAVPDFEDSLMLGCYCFAALIGGQLTARIRAQEREERQREQRATAFFHLTRALAATRTLDEAAAAALRQADELFAARTALLLPDAHGRLEIHPASSFRPGEAEFAVASAALHSGRSAGRYTGQLASVESLALPLQRAGLTLGIFAVRLPEEIVELTARQRDLIEGFAAQIALFVEREQLRAGAEREKLLVESDRLHRTLLDSVSHELKTPLSVLRSAAEKLGTTDAVKRASLTAEITLATHRLDRLVANLLDQTRLETGGLQVHPDWCDVRDLVGAARRAVGSALDGRPVKVEIAADVPLFMADAVLMEHVLANILLNATRYTPAGSPIRISAGLEADPARIFITVTDRGPGIAPELMPHLFQKFHRGSNVRAGGLGLGLSIVRGFVQAQGGEVVVANRGEGGASFTVYLPFAAHGSVPNDER
jgi:two-component system sensor histidine kinase KdpD